MLERIRAVVALGEFDGVHRGHRALMDEAVSMAQRLGGTPVAYTFENHPSSAFGVDVELLNTVEEKRQLIRLSKCRCDLVKFDLEFASMSPDEFILSLKQKYELVGAVCGFNYNFGKKALGDGALLRELGEKHGFEVSVVGEVDYKGEPISSTRIREAIKSGDIKGANEMLGYDFFYSGTVFSHNKLGSSLGFPTANLALEKIHPRFGVYSATLLHDGMEYTAVAFAGTRQTLSEDMPILEVHAIDRTLDLYNRKISVILHDFLRDEIKFNSLNELKHQIERDVQRTLLR